MGMTKELYKFGADFIASLQYKLPHSDGFFFTITKVADPAYSFSYLFPLAASINTLLAADLLVAVLMAEWSNTLLKWVLMEDRPYWWVREAQLEGLKTPVLRQTPLTCETGPGCPSGHVMGSTAVMYVIREWIEQYHITPHKRYSDEKKKKLILLTWLTMIIAAVFVGLSRLYIATHFPHQCVLGFFCGLLVGWLLIRKNNTWTWWWRRGSRKVMLCVSAALISISIGAYWFQRALGIDPQWSVRLAFKWCEQAHYIHVDTTPLYSLVRACGAATGVALASPVHRPDALQGNYIVRAALSGILILLFQSLSATIPTQNALVFYLLHWMLQSVHSWTLLSLLPKVINLLPLQNQLLEQDKENSVKEE